MIQSSCDPICLHNKGLVADQTLWRCCALVCLQAARFTTAFFFHFFFFICLTHEETRESIAVINRKKKKNTGIQTICSTVAFLTNHVIVIHITSIFIHSHGCRVTALAISQILLLCSRYVTFLMDRGHYNKYPWLVTFIVC